MYYISEDSITGRQIRLQEEDYVTGLGFLQKNYLLRKDSRTIVFDDYN